MRSPSTAFETLILPHRGALFVQARQLTGNAADAEDLVQETLVRAYDRFDTLRAEETVKAWLHTILRHLFINDYHRKGRGLQPLSVGLAEEMDRYGITAPDASPEGIVLGRMESRALLQAVAALPKRYREILVSADMQGLTYQQIADRLGLPVGTVRSRLSRARQRVQRSLYAWRGKASDTRHSERRRVVNHANASRAIPFGTMCSPKNSR